MPGELPKGASAVALNWSGAGDALRICMVTRQEGGKVELVPLDRCAAGTSYLGCILDRAGKIVEWVDLMVQATSMSPVFEADGLRAEEKDAERYWRQYLSAVREGGDKLVIWTGWEEEPQPPVDFGGGKFGAEGACVMVRRHCPFSYEAAVDLLGGATLEEMSFGRVPPDFRGIVVGVPARLTEEPGPWARLSPERARSSGLVETAFLKTRLLLRAMEAARDATAIQKRPILGLSSESFGVRFAGGEHLLAEWSFDLALVDFGDARRLAIPAQGVELYRNLSAGGSSLYQPEIGPPQFGTCAVRLPRIQVGGNGAMTAEITVTAQQKVDAVNQDLLCIEVQTASGPQALYAWYSERAALAEGEWRLQSLPQVCSPQQVAELRSLEGQLLRNCRYRFISASGLGGDLYSLAVLAVRTFLVDRVMSLGEALDRVRSLADEVVQRTAGADLPARVAEVFRGDRRWAQQLGAFRATLRPVDAEQAAEAIPNRLWYGILAAILQMLPGRGGLGLCKDIADGTIAEASAMYSALLTPWQQVQRGLQTLLLSGVEMNREIQQVLEEVRSGSERRR